MSRGFAQPVYLQSTAAAEIGLVDEVVPENEVLATAMKRAKEQMLHERLSLVEKETVQTFREKYPSTPKEDLPPNPPHNRQQ